MRQIKVRKYLRNALLQAKLDYLTKKVQNYMFYQVLYKGKYQSEIDSLWLKIRLCRLLLGLPENNY